MKNHTLTNSITLEKWTISINYTVQYLFTDQFFKVEFILKILYNWFHFLFSFSMWLLFIRNPFRFISMWDFPNPVRFILYFTQGFFFYPDKFSLLMFDCVKHHYGSKSYLRKASLSQSILLHYHPLHISTLFPRKSFRKPISLVSDFPSAVCFEQICKYIPISLSSLSLFLSLTIYIYVYICVYMHIHTHFLTYKGSIL